MRVGRWLRRGVLTLIVVLMLAVLATYVLLRMSLPQLADRAPLPGLSAATSVTRDALGVVTVDAGDRVDAYRALGFVHAQERFFEMDLLRRSSAGELAEMFGERALAVDRKQRMHRFRARARRDIDLLSAGERALLDAYADGVNQGLAQLRARPFPYLLLGVEPRRWNREDCALVVFAMFLDLQGGENREELARAAARKHLPAALAAWLDPRGSEWDAALDGSIAPSPVLPSAQDIDLRTLPRQWFEGEARAQREQKPGSNNFAVGGALTTHGAALVANDMHLGLRVPNIWFRARLKFPDKHAPDGRVDISGATLPGTPAMVVGSNTHVAWGFTNSYGDWMDWVEVHWFDTARTRYATAAGWRSVESLRESIAVKDSAPVELFVRETIWGPILHEPSGAPALALAWTAHRPGAFNLGVGALERARDLDDAIKIITHAGLPAQNFVGGDTRGRIGWVLGGRIPIRTGFDAGVPADWSEPGVGWSGWLPPAQNPRVVDPPDGRLWTANARNVGGDAATVLGDGGLTLGARGRQIRDGLRARDRFVPADMLAIQRDNRAVFLQHWWQLLRDTASRYPDDAGMRELSAAIAQAPERASADSVSYRLTRHFRTRVIANVLDMLTAPIHAADPDAPRPSPAQSEAVVWPLITQKPPHLLAPIYSDWNALLERSARDVIDELAPMPGGLARRTWGERNTSVIDHPLGAIPGLSWLLNTRAQALPGDVHMPFVQGTTFGASERFAVSPGHEEEGYFHMPGGQSGHPLSPFYRAGHDDWVAGRATPFLPGPALHRLQLVPQ